ncbi:MAG: hypothetical protein QOF58_6566 [Pseudonocardiales bacterium]|nr:hypothetical protein [Pseudonocardiales bacterium]
MAGHLALGFRQGWLLVGARDVEYRVDEQGAIVVDWVQGPYPSEVAAGLAAYSAVGWLPVEAAASGSDSPGRGTVRADLLVDGAPVVLHAYDAIGMERAERVARPKRELPPRWKWPSSLTAEGGARDTVLWTDSEDGMVATVVRLPIDPQGPWWSEDGIAVAMAPQDMPSGLRSRRRREIDEFRDHSCAILLRRGATWSAEEADEWMTAELDREMGRAPDCVAVVWRDRCVVRRWTGLRMEATCDERPAFAPWTHVPSAVHASLVRDRSRREPPGVMKVRAFGNVFGVLRVTITSTWGAPTRRFADSPGVSW